MNDSTQKTLGTTPAHSLREAVQVELLGCHFDLLGVVLWLSVVTAMIVATNRAIRLFGALWLVCSKADPLTQENESKKIKTSREKKVLYELVNLHHLGLISLHYVNPKKDLSRE